MNPPRTPTSTSPEDAHGTPEQVDRVVEQLLDDAASPAVALLSDLTRDGAARLRERWQEIPLERRRGFVVAMTDDAEADIRRNYDRALLVALDDRDAEVRLAAVEGLAELETGDFLDTLLARVDQERDDRVRATQVAALGRYVLLSELGSLEAADADRLRDRLIQLAETDNTPDVRRRALESLGYLSDDGVSAMIGAAYESAEHARMVSALHAMGRQGSDAWLAVIHRELSSDEPELRYEAVVAAGAIGSEASVLPVIDAIEDDDIEVRLAAIAALGSIGGRTAMNALRRLVDDQSPAVAEAAEDALQEASLTATPLRPLF